MRSSSSTTLDRPLVSPAVRELPDEAFAVEFDHPPLYGVILHNDPISSMEFVVGVLQKVFGYNLARAAQLMLQAHLKGRSLVWSGSLEVAELRMEQIQSCGADPARREAGAQPLSVSLEPLWRLRCRVR